jgi:molybdopterin-guanine dinucleotide biosynthesis protein A
VIRPPRAGRDLRSTTLGVLVAGGHGSRLGPGGPKALVEIGGVTLLARALAILESVCAEVVVAAPPALALPVPAALRVADIPGAGGPLAGVAAGLGARRYELALVLGVDFPLMCPGALAALRERIGPETALVPAPGGRPQPLAAAYRPAAAGPLAAALERGERALVPAVLALGPRLLDDAALAGFEGGLDNFFNLNTPEDLAAAQRWLKSVAAAPRETGPGPGERVTR